MADQKFKSKVKAQGGLNLPQETASRVPVVNATGDVVSSTVTDTELGYVSGVTSSIQTQLSTNATNISNHTGAVSGAHAASAISNTPSGNLAATDVQAALNEIQSDVDTRALDSVVIKKDGTVAFTADQSMGGFKLTNLAAPATASDAATKGYVDSALEGLKPKQAVRAATTVAGTLATDFANTSAIDGVTLATGDRILIKDQAAPAENGIYVVQATGAPVRATDFDSVSPIDEINKAYVAVQEGTSNAGKLFVQYGLVTTIGTDAINFTFFNSVSGLTGGDGITVSGSNISIDHDGQGLQFVATQLALELDGTTLSKSATGLKLSDTAVTPASYGSASSVGTFTVDQQGRLTAAASTSISITASQVSDFTAAAKTATGSAGDIYETSFSLANNQVTAADVTGLAFNAASVRSFKALVSVAINATLGLYEAYELVGINKGGTAFDMAVSAVGDDSGVVFTITAAGQVQYTSANYAGFVSGTAKFRAITTTV